MFLYHLHRDNQVIRQTHSACQPRTAPPCAELQRGFVDHIKSAGQSLVWRGGLLDLSVRSLSRFVINNSQGAPVSFLFVENQILNSTSRRKQPNFHQILYFLQLPYMARSKTLLSFPAPCRNHLSSCRFFGKTLSISFAFPRHCQNS